MQPLEAVSVQGRLRFGHARHRQSYVNRKPLHVVEESCYITTHCELEIVFSIRSQLLIFLPLLFESGSHVTNHVQPGRRSPLSSKDNQSSTAG